MCIRDRFKPGHPPTGIGIEISFLLGQNFVKRLVDQGEGLPHAQRIALDIDYLCVTGVYGHSRADSRLCQVYRGNVAALQVIERYRQPGFKRTHKLAAGGDRSIICPRPADKDDTGGEGVGASF